MALINSYSDANKVTLNDKVVWYSKTRIYGNWSYESASVTYYFYNCWQYQRFCTKQFAYIGMSLEAAQTCATDMISKFNRSILVSEVRAPQPGFTEIFSEFSGGSVVMASVTIQKREGHMYDVVVNVSEHDTKLRLANVSTETLFTTENQREY